MYSSHTFSTEFLGFARFAGFVHFEAELYSPRHFSALMFCDEDGVIVCYCMSLLSFNLYGFIEACRVKGWQTNDISPL